ncbi:MAG: hypothetical protein ABSC94_03700 [Polyangiaceae bacterium]|jgi:hypothetical protein
MMDQDQSYERPMRLAMRVRFSCVVGAVLLAESACTNAPLTAGGDAGGPGSDAAGPVFYNDGSSNFLGSVDSGTNEVACSAASQLVYVLSNQNEIYSFDPPTKVFTNVVSLHCPDGSMSPNSMAIDRQGNAWVDYVSVDGYGNVFGGAIFKVDLTTGTCEATNITLLPRWYQVGMGFSTASVDDPTDTLYVSANSQVDPCVESGVAPSSAGLASIDFNTGMLSPIGPFSGAFEGQNAELTGTGDGRLFGFFDLSVVQVAQIDKTSGATSSPISIPGLHCPWAFAFSFWGGDFYLYTAPSLNANSSVTHYTAATGTIDTSYVPDVGFEIVGAGVSTCAPTTPPH